MGIWILRKRADARVKHRLNGWQPMFRKVKSGLTGSACLKSFVCPLLQTYAHLWPVLPSGKKRRQKLQHKNASRMLQLTSQQFHQDNGLITPHAILCIIKNYSHNSCNATAFRFWKSRGRADRQKSRLQSQTASSCWRNDSTDRKRLKD